MVQPQRNRPCSWLWRIKRGRLTVNKCSKVNPEMTASTVTPPSISSTSYHYYASTIRTSSTMRSTILAISLAFALPARAFDCALTVSGIQYDLKPLGGLRTATHTSSTPPTSNEARVLMNLCGDIGSEDGVSDEDKVSQPPSQTTHC
jgi:hypothetical protein